MTIAVLALQGAFIEHEQMLQKLGVHTIELRQASDLQKDFDGIILPGGESTVQGKLLHDLNMFEPLKEKIQSGMPVLATCAGMILLASDIAEQEESYFGTIPMTVKRNAYGREMIMFLTLFFMIMFTVIQIRVPLDIIPDKWSNFEFWSEFYKNKQESVLLMRSMKRGVVDLGYITGFQRASIIGVISIVQARTLARLIA